MTEEPSLLTVAQAAAHLGVGPSAVRERIRLGRLPSERHGARRLLRRTDVIVAANVKAFYAGMRAAGCVVHRH